MRAGWRSIESNEVVFGQEVNAWRKEWSMSKEKTGKQTEGGSSEQTGRFSEGAEAESATQGCSPTVLSQSEFNAHYNLAFLGEDLPRASVRQVLKHYVGSVAIYGVLLLFVTLNPWFSNLLSISFKGVTGIRIYYYLFATYVVIAPLILFVGRPRSLWVSKNLLILGFLWRVIRVPFRRDLGGDWRRFKPDYREANAGMFLLIKLMYGPLMLHSLMLELVRFSGLRFQIFFQSTWLDVLDVRLFMFISAVFMLDSLLFFIGYSTESGLMRNRLRYAETNLFRILVCIACYGPFNMVTISVLGPSNHQQFLFQGDLSHPMTWILRGLAALFSITLVTSSLFLFTKASNLTNRGIVKTGPYALVRHPGYMSKNLLWLTTLIPAFFPDPTAVGFSWGVYALVFVKTLLGWLAWGSIYFLRAITEEQFLSRDPEYVAYCRKVKYRFIPWVY